MMQNALKYHHLGIPTATPRAGEHYLEQFKMYVSGYDTGPYGIEWMRFESDSPMPDLVKSVPHIAFEVEDLKATIKGKDVLIPPNSPSAGVVVAFIVDNGAPIEFLQIEESPGRVEKHLMAAILDSLKGPVLFADTDHVTRYMNRAAIAHYTGGTELIGRSLLECHNAESVQMMIEILQAMQTQGEEERLISDDEQYRIYMRAVRDPEGTVLGYYERYESKVPQ